MDANLYLQFISSSPIFNGLCCLLLLIPLAVCGFLREPQLPLVNGSKLFEIGKSQARKRFYQNAAGLIQSGLRKANAFRIITHNESLIVLAPKFAREIRDHPDLETTAVFLKSFHAHIAGFEANRQIENEGIVQELIRTKLTRSLAKITGTLAAESSLLLKQEWTNNRDWHAIPAHKTVTSLIAQLSSLVFVGEELSRNTEWHKTVISYTENMNQATHQLNRWPEFARPIVARFNPTCRNLRQHIVRARELMLPVIQKRALAKETGVQKEHQDVLQWLEEIANGRKHDPVLMQMLVALASIHTSSDALCQVLYDICSYENQKDLVQELRDEVITAIRESGWEKGALQKLKLMDSVLKESQRLKPIAILGMNRHANQKIELSDGTVIPKGASLLIANFSMCDADAYSDPAAFDPYRFLRRREAGDSSALYVSPSPEHLGFGFGKHSCPGRFFVAHEIKVVLAHMLLKYDIKLLDFSPPTVKKIGVALTADPTAKLCIRRRQEEISLDPEPFADK